MADQISYIDLATFATILAAAATIFFNARSIRKENNRKAAATLNSIHVEILCIWGIYNKNAGFVVEGLSDDEAFDFHYKIDEEYCPVFHANALNIGNISCCELRKEIINYYILIKSLIESFRYNNEIAQCEDYIKRAELAQNIKQLHYKVKTTVKKINDLTNNIESDRNKYTKRVMRYIFG